MVKAWHCRSNFQLYWFNHIWPDQFYSTGIHLYSWCPSDVLWYTKMLLFTVFSSFPCLPFYLSLWVVLFAILLFFPSALCAGHGVWILSRYPLNFLAGWWNKEQGESWLIFHLSSGDTGTLHAMFPSHLTLLFKSPLYPLQLLFKQSYWSSSVRTPSVLIVTGRRS